MNKIISTRVIAALLVAGGGFAETSHGQALPPVEVFPGGPAYMPGEVLVRFRESADEQQVRNAFGQAQLNLVKHVQTPAMRDNGHPGVSHTLTALDVPTAVRVLNNLPWVVYAEPNWVYSHQAEATDPFYVDGRLWGMYSDDQPSLVGPANTTNDYGCGAEKAWAAGQTGSSDIYVGVVDTGIQDNHQDLAPNIWTNPGEVPGNGIDDDQNGYVDDVHGWNAISDNGVTFDPGYDNHGTHVSGTIGAIQDNTGVVGVNWNVRIISGKFLGRNGSGATLDAAQAIDYMTTLKQRKGLNIVALNNSWGGGGFSQTLLDAMGRAAQADILFIAAAGNGATNVDLSTFYPAAYNTTTAAGYDSVVSVAAIDKTGALATFSNYGAQTVDLGAPGVEIWSTLATNNYGAYKGTSMATPHVTGSLALYAAGHGGLSAAQMRSDLLSLGVAQTASLAGKTVSGGRVDVSRLAALPGSSVAAPVTPANVQLQAGVGGVRITWDSAGPVLGYRIERSQDGLNTTFADSVGGGSTQYEDRTAQPGATYYYRVSAYVNGASSAPSLLAGPVAVPSVPVPAAPANLTATALRPAGVSLAWSDRSSNEAGFLVERSLGNNGNWTAVQSVGPNVTSFVDLTTAARTIYTYRIRAFNLAGSALSNSSQVRTR